MDKNIIKKFVNMFISMMNIANPRRIIVHVASLFLLLKDRFLVPVITHTRFHYRPFYYRSSYYYRPWSTK